ncbi:MAG: hypothetical protein KIT45_02225 [Fimbriimonadia bacterium]|nr:hypothetical protein [Fimbriimonadia bacterium]
MTDTGTDNAKLEWTVHLIRQSPEKLPLTLLALIGAPVLGYVLMRHWLFAAVGFWIMLSATADYLFPIRFRIDSEGARQRTAFGLRLLLWSRIKRIRWDTHGVLLSPLAQPSRLDAYRGVYLLYGDDQEAEIRDWIQRYAPDSVLASEPKSEETTLAGCEQAGDPHSS